MDEQELAERLRRNPDLRRLNPGITDNTCNTGNTRMAVIQPSEQELQDRAAAMLESELQSELRRIALANKWLYYHTHSSKKSDIGFPDTVLLRITLNRGELYFVECKREGQEPTEEQQRWIEGIKAFRTRALNFAGMNVTVNAFVWKPMDLLSGLIAETLNPKPNRRERDLMCQAYEGERRFMAAMDGFVAREGWAAHRDGLPREYDNILHDDAFFFGWDCRAEYERQGDPIPHEIVKTFRRQRGRETGTLVFHEEPTLAEADEIA